MSAENNTEFAPGAEETVFEIEIEEIEQVSSPGVVIAD